jgi:hypothetical protein
MAAAPAEAPLDVAAGAVVVVEEEEAVWGTADE